MVRTCENCRHFRNDAGFLENALAGLASLSSAHASVRTDDGLCAHHARYVGAQASCADFAARLTTSRPGA